MPGRTKPAKKATRGRSALSRDVDRKVLEEQRKLGAKLKKLRKAARLNQEQVEERTGLPTRTLSSLENAHHAAGLASLVACAVAYGVSLRDLFDD